MMQSTRCFGLLFAVTMISAANGVNTCLDLSGTTCAAGTTQVSLQDCALQDSDSADLAACFDQVGRAEIKNIFISGNPDLTTFDVDTFEGMTGMTILQVMDSGLTSLPLGLFDNLPALLGLQIFSNDLPSLEVGIFNGLTVQSLNLIGNRLTELPAGLFDGLTGLQSLMLNENVLTTVAPGVFDGLTGLTSLNLADNELTTLPSGIFSSLSASATLELMRNQDLQCLPATSARVVLVEPVSTSSAVVSTSVTSSNFEENVTTGTCTCSPEDVVQCDMDSECSPGDDGYTCDGGSGGMNACLDSESSDYRCARNRGGRTVDLSSCGLTDDDGDDLRACIKNAVVLKKMTSINLEDNDFTTLPANLLKGMRKLEELNLSNNCDLECVPAPARKCKHLDYILSDCNEDAEEHEC